MSLYEIASVLLQLVTAGAIVFAVFQVVGSRTQRHREFENLYVQRYWALLDRMSLQLYTGSTRRRLSGQDKDKRVIHDYLRLCEDELDLRREGFITDRTWEIWSKGILAQLAPGPYLTVFESRGEGELPMLTSFLDGYRDPLTWGKRKRWWSGLR